MKRAFQKITDVQQEDMTGVMLNSRLTTGGSPVVIDNSEMSGPLKADINNPEALAKALRQYQEKFRLLLGYIDNLIGINHRLEDQLQQTSDASIVGRTMVAGLAHDLRNPMAVISSCAQFCLENEQLTPVTKEYLQMIQENSKEANKLLNQFVEFAKVNLTFKSLNLNQTIEKTWQLALMDAGHREVIFKAHLAEDIPEIFGDPGKIKRVLLNLFLNAIQAVSQNCREGMVTVQTRFLPSQNLAEVTIIDNGPGIPEEIQDKIFEPFFTTKEGGTGLGLYLCRYFIEQHKGKIMIGKAPKGGTKVTVRLPAAQGKKDSALLEYSNMEQTDLTEQSDLKFLNEALENNECEKGRTN